MEMPLDPPEVNEPETEMVLRLALLEAQRVADAACAWWDAAVVAKEARAAYDIWSNAQTRLRSIAADNAAEAALSRLGAAVGAYHDGGGAVKTEPTQASLLRERLAKIAAIIEAVDQRCDATDGLVPTTQEEMTQEEINQIYQLSKTSATR